MFNMAVGSVSHIILPMYSVIVICSNQTITIQEVKKNIRRILLKYALFDHKVGVSLDAVKMPVHATAAH